VTAMQVVQPDSVTRTYTQTLVAGPEVVFPLLCPRPRGARRR
jgi:hypothetical protein